jgi:hypothetical protein
MDPRSFVAAAAVAAAVLAVASPAQAADVGVSVQVSQPGVYGRIDIGKFPQPAVVVAAPVVVTRPVVVAPAPTVVVARPEPVYMWVPPGHRRNWRKHCGSYNACGVPVYFVQDGWYQQHVMRGDRDDRGERGNGHGKGRGRGHDKG